MGIRTTTFLAAILGCTALALLAWLMPIQAAQNTPAKNMQVDSEALASAESSPAKAPQVKEQTGRQSEQEATRGSVRALLIAKRKVAITSLAVDSVKEINVAEGDQVKKGQVLVKFHCHEIQASLRLAKSRLAQHEIIHAANVELMREQAITVLERDLSKAKLEEGKSEVALDDAQARRCVVTAPYDGTAVVVNVRDFANVQVGEPLLTIVDDKNFELILNVPSPWLQSRQGLINKRFEVSIDETGKSYNAIVERIGAVIDPSSRTVQLTAVIVGTNPELAAGMSGNAILSSVDP